MKYLIVGLGNIGDAYVDTRHNIGFKVLDHIAKKQEATFRLDKKAYVTNVKHKGKQLYLIKPTTYMNLSGEAVRYWMQKLSIPQERLLVVSDDIHLPLGQVRLRPKGSSGGHNGIAHIQSLLGSQYFARLRCGIGNNFLPGKQADYVLSNFSTQEQPILESFILFIAQAIQDFCTQATALVMNRYNQKKQYAIFLPQKS